MNSQAATRRVYALHLFPVVRLKISGVQAASHVEAIEQALDQVGPELEGRFAPAGVEYAETISHYLVDVAGDADFSRSQWFYSGDEPLLTFLRRLAAWEESGGDAATLQKLIADVRRHLSCVV